jgi:hypothetical protein
MPKRLRKDITLKNGTKEETGGVQIWENRDR